MAASLQKCPSFWNNAREEHKQGEPKNMNTFAATVRIRWGKERVKSHQSGATFAVGFTKNAAV